MEAENQAQVPWWGSFTVKEGEAGCWRVGPSTVWIYRARHEWRLVHEQSDDHLDASSMVTLPAPLDAEVLSLDAVRPERTLNRFSFHQTDEYLTLLPALADRAVVVRPEQPLYVPEGETVRLYVSTPLWLCAEVGRPAKPLMELPLYRPSDTWFGASTLEGELCYAVKSMGRLRLDDLPRRHHRAVTPIRIDNRAEDALLIERMRLPVGHLSLYQTSDAFLWTQAVTLEREKGAETATLHLGESPPADAPEATLLREPRDTVRTSLIIRPFSMLFHKIKEA